MIRHLAPLGLAAALAATPALAFDITSMTEGEKAAFGDAVRDYLVENPEVIVEAINVLETRQAEAQAQADFDLVAQHADAIFDDGFSWEGGNPDGDITLVEFLDYRCGYCRRAHPEVAELLAEDGNIRVIIKEFPILGEASMISSRFAIATKHVAGDDAYAQVHDILMEFSGEPTDVALRRIAEGLGLEADPILEAMDSEAVTAEIAETRALAQALQISGTPTFVLEDELLRGFVPADQMAVMVADKRG
ncbi:DsbA family protein [Marinibacterium profundimaris]|uniref:DSBA oxidoreductase n=1 Tax=Marinibacterium profundimaris TaxID=1679460 RepID=A0A225NLS2_9RHOB|nr:DsbA family protein [Marinibacterium profundimaris]OWU74883.1 DSBA oxidoreductase [Marinibacterium profundimaris]